jgi:hypothetical protein
MCSVAIIQYDSGNLTGVNFFSCRRPADRAPDPVGEDLPIGFCFGWPIGATVETDEVGGCELWGAIGRNSEHARTADRVEPLVGVSH